MPPLAIPDPQAHCVLGSFSTRGYSAVPRHESGNRVVRPSSELAGWTHGVTAQETPLAFPEKPDVVEHPRREAARTAEQNETLQFGVPVKEPAEATRWRFSWM